MKFTYIPEGVCSRKIIFEIGGDGVLEELAFEGGCNGNLKGIATLARGRKAEEMIGLLSGIACGMKPTSCPDQLARAISSALEQMEGGAAEKQGAS